MLLTFPINRMLSPLQMLFLPLSLVMDTLGMSFALTVIDFVVEQPPFFASTFTVYSLATVKVESMLSSVDLPPSQLYV